MTDEPTTSAVTMFEQPLEWAESTTPDAGGMEVAPRQRQCGRCRDVFAIAPDLDPRELSDWWVCPPCRATLFPSTVVVTRG